MPQTLYMVLVDTDEATPKEMGEKLQKFAEDYFPGHFAISTVLDAGGYDYDGSDGMQLVDELGDLQAEIAESKT